MNLKVFMIFKDVVSLPKCLMLCAIQFRGGAYNRHASTHPTNTTNQETPEKGY